MMTREAIAFFAVVGGAWILSILVGIVYFAGRRLRHDRADDQG